MRIGYKNTLPASTQILLTRPVDPFTLHDLRRKFATIHAKIGTPIHVTEKLLNHVSGTISGVAAVCNRHSYLDEMRDAIEQYDGYVSGFTQMHLS
jgi:integrase